MQQHAVHDRVGGGGGGVGGGGLSGGMPPQKTLKIRCSEVHFGTLSSEIEQRKVVKKLIFKGPLFSLQGQ